MSDLNLNEQGISFSRNQRRVADFITKFARERDIEVQIAEDFYIAPTLLKGPFLSTICRQLDKC